MWCRFFFLRMVAVFCFRLVYHQPGAQHAVATTWELKPAATEETSNICIRRTSLPSSIEIPSCLVVLTILKHISQWEGLSHIWNGKYKMLETTNQLGDDWLILVTGTLWQGKRPILDDRSRRQIHSKRSEALHIHFQPQRHRSGPDSGPDTFQMCPDVSSLFQQRCTIFRQKWQ